jgi:hypothetical protein
MTSITIPTDDTLWRGLNELAQQQNTGVTEIALQAIRAYIKSYAPKQKRRYSFVGIGRSGRGRASVDAEEILAREIDRRAGWSFPA